MGGFLFLCLNAHYRDLFCSAGGERFFLTPITLENEGHYCNYFEMLWKLYHNVCRRLAEIEEVERFYSSRIIRCLIEQSTIPSDCLKGNNLMFLYG